MVSLSLCRTATLWCGGGPLGRIVYVTNVADTDISAYSIGFDGELKPISGSPFAAGALPTFVAVDALGRFVYVTKELPSRKGSLLHPR